MEESLSDNNLNNNIIGILNSSAPDEVQQYIQGLELTEETILRYELAYCPANSLLEKCLHENIIFPIRSVIGDLDGYIGRNLHWVKGGNMMKYTDRLNPKSHAVFGLFQAGEHVKKANNCYIVEGIADVLYLAEKGILNVISCNGSSFTSGQIAMIRLFCHHVTLLYDGDNIGQKSARRQSDLFLENGFDVSCITIPEDKSPFAFFKGKSFEEIKAFLAVSAKEPTHEETIPSFPEELMCDDAPF